METARREIIHQKCKELKNDSYGAGLVYELWEPRYYRAAKAYVDSLENADEKELALGILGTDVMTTSTCSENTGWECEECGKSLDENELLRSMSVCGEAYCSLHLAAQVC